MTAQYLPTKKTLFNALYAHALWTDNKERREPLPYDEQPRDSYDAMVVIADLYFTTESQIRTAAEVGKEVIGLHTRGERHIVVAITPSGRFIVSNQYTNAGLVLGQTYRVYGSEPGPNDRKHAVFSGRCSLTTRSELGASDESTLDRAMDAFNAQYAQACEDRARWDREDRELENAHAHGIEYLQPNTRTLVLASKKSEHTGTVGFPTWAAGVNVSRGTMNMGTLALVYNRGLAKRAATTDAHVEGLRCVSAPVMPFENGPDSARVFCEAIYPKDSLKNGAITVDTLRAFTRFFELLACDEAATNAVRAIENEYRSLRVAVLASTKDLDKKSVARLRSALRKELAVFVAMMRRTIKPMLVEAGLKDLVRDENEKVQAPEGHDEETNVTYA